MILEKVDLTSKGARHLDSFTSRINTEDYYLVRTDALDGKWITGVFCAPGDYAKWWTFHTFSMIYQLEYKNDDILDKMYVEVYRIDDPERIKNRALKKLLNK